MILTAETCVFRVKDEGRQAGSIPPVVAHGFSSAIPFKRRRYQRKRHKAHTEMLPQKKVASDERELAGLLQVEPMLQNAALPPKDG